MTVCACVRAQLPATPRNARAVKNKPSSFGAQRKMPQRRLPARWVLALLVLVARGCVGDMRGPHHPRSQLVGHSHHRPERGAKVTGDSKLLRDAKHIEEDLLNQGAEYVDTDHMTPEELEFHYFKVHDYDNNTKLDGLEILQAINHAVLEHPGHDQGPLRDFDYFVELIDRVLAEDDVDGDGYLSYAEYVKGRGRDRAKRMKAETIIRNAADMQADA